MHIHVLTLFPGMFESVLGSGIFRRAREASIVDVVTHDIRAHAHDKHHIVDDYTYGGGAGMVLKPEPVFEAVETVKASIGAGATASPVPVILLSPQGRLFTQTIAEQLARYENLILICGHYEGMDERISEHLASDEISIGDYILSGGELPAMVVVDAIIRLIPGVLGSYASTREESHTGGLLEYPQYTRPPVYRGWAVPEVLLSGNHAEIARWRRKQSIIRTLKRRPDLLTKASLSPAEAAFVETLKEKEQGVAT